MSLAYSSFSDMCYIVTQHTSFDDLLDVRGQRGLHVVRVVLYVVVLQDPLQTSVLIILPIIASRSLSVQVLVLGATLALQEAGCLL